MSFCLTVHGEQPSMAAVSVRYIGRPSLAAAGGSANLSANGEANPGSNLAEGLAEARGPKACEIRRSAFC